MQNPLTDFDKAIRVAGLRQIQKLHWDKGECFLVTFKICFMQTPQIVNFYLTNLESHLFWGILTSTQSRRAVSNQKAQMNVSGSLSSFVYTRPPNSQLLLCKPVKTLLGLRASGLHCIKKLHKTKSECFWVTFKSSVMKDPRIPNFNLTNLERDPFYGFLMNLYGLGATSNQKIK